MVAEQAQVRAGATADRWWRRLAPAFALAGMTGLVVWVAVDELLRQGRLGTVLGAGRAELPPRCSWRWWPGPGSASGSGPPGPVEQEASAGPALLLVAEQLAEPFRARA
jgi:hypothetical protein